MENDGAGGQPANANAEAGGGLAADLVPVHCAIHGGGQPLQGGQPPQISVRQRLQQHAQQQLANQPPNGAQNQIFLSIKFRENLIPPPPGTMVTYLLQLVKPLSQCTPYKVAAWAKHIYDARGASAAGTMASVVAQHTKEFIIRQHNTADNVNAINEDDFDAMSDREALETILRALAPRSAEACTNLIKQTERSTVHDNSDRSTAKLATFVSYRETMRQNYDLTRNLVDSPTFKKTFLDNLFDPTLKALLKVLIADPIISAAQFMDFCIDEATKKQRHEHEAKAANSNSSYSISALEHSRYAQQSRENSRGRDDNRRFSRDNNNLSSSLSAFRHDSSRDRDRRDYSSSQARDDSRGRYQQRNSSRHGYDRISSRNRDARADSQPRNDRSRSRERVESRDRGRDQQRDRSQTDKYANKKPRFTIGSFSTHFIYFLFRPP